MMVRQRLQYLHTVLAVVIVCLLAAACASTTIGKAVQSAEAQKKLVEAAAVEFVKLHMRGDPRVTDAVYAQGKAAYQKYFAAQTSLANALASWKTVSNAENEARLTAALTEATNTINVYLALVSQFVDLNALKSKVGASLQLRGVPRPGPEPGTLIWDSIATLQGGR